MARYISCADTAKLIRAQLKKHFPGQKFSVRSDTYAGGASIDVKWTDGPTQKDVDAVVKSFAGGGFDGSIDMAYSVTSVILEDGSAALADSRGTEGSGGSHQAAHNLSIPSDFERVRFGADFVFTSREISDAHVASIKARWLALNGSERSRLFQDCNVTRAIWNAPHSYALDNDLTDFGKDAGECFRQIARMTAA